MRRWLAIALVSAVVAYGAAPEGGVVVVDHGLRPKKYPVYLGKERGWQDLYNQDERGAYYLEREIGFRNTRLNLRITQAYVGDESRPTGRLGVRFPKGSRNVTPTQPLWCSTWCRYGESFRGLLDVLIGDQGLAGVAPTFDYGTSGEVGFVRVRWRHEQGQVSATFLMLPDDDRLFCEVGVDAEVGGPVSVSLCCWPFGDFVYWTGAGRTDPLRYGREYVLPANEKTVLFTDPKFDTRGKECQGTCAITYFPDECVSVSVKRTFPLFVTMNLPESETRQTVYAHFVLWELLHRRGEEAFSYVTGREAETTGLFERLPMVQEPRFAVPREQGIEEVRRTLRATDGERAGVSVAQALGVSQDSTKCLPASALARRWAGFYRSEARRHLASSDWANAARAADLAATMAARIAK